MGKRIFGHSKKNEIKIGGRRMDIRELTAPCGLGCFACAFYRKNITEELTKGTAKNFGVEAKEIPCDGCRSERGCSFEMPLTCGKGCITKKCVEDRGLHNCSECDEFPCENLMPVADMGERVPHNTKMYNLSRIKLNGIESWGEEAAEIQKKYFKGKFVYGTFPSISEDEK